MYRLRSQELHQFSGGAAAGELQHSTTQLAAEYQADLWIPSSVAGGASPSFVAASPPPEELDKYTRATLTKQKRKRPRGATATSALLKAAGVKSATGRTPKGLEAAAEAELRRPPGVASWDQEADGWVPVGRAPLSQKAAARRPMAQAALVATNSRSVLPQPSQFPDLPQPCQELLIDTTETKSCFYEDTMEQMLVCIGASRPTCTTMAITSLTSCWRLRCVT